MLAHPEVANWLVYQNVTAFNKWLSIVGMIQGMDVNERATRTHVAYESESWIEAFTLSNGLSPQTQSLLSGYVDMRGWRRALTIFFF